VPLTLYNTGLPVELLEITIVHAIRIQSQTASVTISESGRKDSDPRQLLPI
jgi:hypothetical protein